MSDNHNNDTNSNSSVKVDQNDPIFKTVGITLAISSAFIGISFVLKKKGLLAANEFAGKGYAYLSNGLWWSGMILTILVTPLGALSVVVSAICSSIFLKERLSMQGKIGCAQCIIGAIIIVMHAPPQHSATSIDEFRSLFFSPGFLSYAIVCIVLSGLIIWRLAPNYGSRNMLVYISVCSIIGSLSVVTTQGLGIAILKTIEGENQFTHWFTYFLIVFIVVTLLIEINYLNKALNLFNTAMVTPVYYVVFTSLTIISSSILTKGFEAPPQGVVTVVLGFLVICSGIVLLQTSKGTVVDLRNPSILSPTGTIINHDMETVSTLNNNNSLLMRANYIEPGASEIRASFGSIKRYSMNFSAIKESATLSYDLPTSMTAPPTKTIINKHRHKRSMSVNFEEGKDLSGLKTRNKGSGPQRSNSTKSMPDPAIINEFENDKVDDDDKNDEKKPYGQPKQLLKLDHHIDILSLPSPLQHPINYIKQHLSPTNSLFQDNGGTSDGIRISRLQKASTRRSQNSMHLVDKMKSGMNSSESKDEHEVLVGQKMV
ncbi:3345_t:CDS:2 [Entrophospora sp. SA101]|nr:13893_t:CDS:2 [Entrophospora sp. SA101]CAJ0840730.1 4576_t:CDS:2 [Entrophospora sp. SA101]CAJ0905718.1 3345_t:CDS:2 [Entrophospora sp. SA101]